MIQPEGFIDLRAATGNQATEESVWPSFTDIMTVIVMIFLMALVVILIRNVDLVRQLKQTIALEQESAIQSDTLALRIATLGDEVAGLQLQLGETDARRRQAESAASDREKKIGVLLGNISALENIRKQLVDENAGLVFSQDALQGELLSMEEQQQALEALGENLKAEVAKLVLQRDTLTAEKTGLTADNMSLQKQLDRSVLERQQLADTIDTIGAEREQYRAESAALGEKNLTLEQKLAELVSLKALLEQRIEALADEKIAFEGERSTLIERNAGLNRKLSALTQFQTQLESQVDNLAAALTKLEEDKVRLLDENRSTTAWLATLLELKQSLEKDQATLKVRLTGAEADRVELEASRLALEQEVAALIGDRLTLEQEKAALIDQTIALEGKMLEQGRNLRVEINTLVLAKSHLEQEKIDLDQQIDVLVRQQAAAKKAQQRLGADLADSQASYRLTKTELDYLVAKHADEIMEFEEEKALLVGNLQAFELLKSQYGDLEIAYNRLVKPARNMVGRHVVKIRYWKEEGHIHYSVQEPNQESAVEMSESELHQRLSALKVAHPGNLFTHVLFPGGKDISQEEAYLFERGIVSRYDYYESD